MAYNNAGDGIVSSSADILYEPIAAFAYDTSGKNHNGNARLSSALFPEVLQMVSEEIGGFLSELIDSQKVFFLLVFWGINDIRSNSSELAQHFQIRWESNRGEQTLINPFRHERLKM